MGQDSTAVAHRKEPPTPHKIYIKLVQNMNHNFNIEIATQYGLEEAVLLENIAFWVLKNAASGEHFYDGNYWTYNSAKAFALLFPYMSAKKIQRTLARLEEQGLIISGNYNKVTYDRTKWYALADAAKVYYSIGQNGDFHWTKLSNGIDKTVQPIPDINTDINTDIYTARHDSPEGERDEVATLPVITLTLNDKSEYGIYDGAVNAWQQLYPAVDVSQQLRNMKGWLDANPTKRKTRRGILKFVNNWLARAQDEGGAKTPTNAFAQMAKGAGDG